MGTMLSCSEPYGGEGFFSYHLFGDGVGHASVVSVQQASRVGC